MDLGMVAMRRVDIAPEQFLPPFIQSPLIAPVWVLGLVTGCPLLSVCLRFCLRRAARRY